MAKPLPLIVVGIALLTPGLACSQALPIQAVREWIDHARSNPGKMSYASTGNGSTNTVSLELFKAQTGTRLFPVYYKAASIHAASVHQNERRP